MKLREALTSLVQGTYENSSTEGRVDHAMSKVKIMDSPSQNLFDFLLESNDYLIG